MTTAETSTPQQELRGRGLQVTAQRLAVLGAITQTPHGTAEEIADVVRSDIGSISRQGIYDVLGTLVEAGLLRRIQPAGSPARYEGRVDDNHHHLVCRGCGRVVDVACAHGSAPCLETTNDHGFEVDEAEVIYWGTCPECQMRDKTEEVGK